MVNLKFEFEIEGNTAGITREICEYSEDKIADMMVDYDIDREGVYWILFDDWIHNKISSTGVLIKEPELGVDITWIVEDKKYKQQYIPLDGTEIADIIHNHNENIAIEFMINDAMPDFFRVDVTEV